MESVKYTTTLMLLNNCSDYNTVVSVIKMTESVTVQILSDVHPEYTHNLSPKITDYLDPIADVLVLAGDCGNLHKPAQLENLLLSACTEFKYVLYTPGNHEYYRIPANTGIPMSVLERTLMNIVDQVNSRLVDSSNKPAGKRLWLLQKSCIKIGTTLFAGCTLWSRPTFQSSLPNYIVRITTDIVGTEARGMTKEEYTRMHDEHVEFLYEVKDYYATDTTTDKLVIITHHPPCRDMFQRTELTDEFASLYYTDLPREIFNDVDVWINGHIHKTYDITTPEGCRIVSNQLGKPKRHFNSDFIRDFIVEI